MKHRHMTDTTLLLADIAQRASRYLDDVRERRVFPAPEDVASLRGFSVPLQEESMDPAAVVRELDSIGSPATVASAGGRYFGFVTGGSLPAALASNMLAAAWDQNSGMEANSPVAAHLERVCCDWLTRVLGLPGTCGVGFVTGATMANFTALAAARHAVLQAQGWDVERKGLFGAPEITVIVGEEVHVSVVKGIGLLGLGRERVVRVPVDDQGRMIAAAIPPVAGPTIVCVQAGNVNTGAFDPAAEIIPRLSGKAWVHVDGAFGLWAAVAPATRHLARGLDKADSLATDAHKWLNVPYDSGLVFVREPRHLNAAMAASAAYLVEGKAREPHLATPELSRRARGVDVWAALRSLGTRGLAQMIEGTCAHARRIAEAMRAAGHAVLNDVVLNQVLVSFGSPDVTNEVIRRIQADGTCWCGGTQWQGRTAMRISVSSWATTEEDVEKSIAAILRCAREALDR
jgi:glutamate/tyrosine decarboxylase-like PLP-dependent enzyme